MDKDELMRLWGSDRGPLDYMLELRGIVRIRHKDAKFRPEEYETILD